MSSCFNIINAAYATPGTLSEEAIWFVSSCVALDLWYAASESTHFTKVVDVSLDTNNAIVAPSSRGKLDCLRQCTRHGDCVGIVTEADNDLYCEIYLGRDYSLTGDVLFARLGAIQYMVPAYLSCEELALNQLPPTGTVTLSTPDHVFFQATCRQHSDGTWYTFPSKASVNQWHDEGRTIDSTGFHTDDSEFLLVLDVDGTQGTALIRQIAAMQGRPMELYFNENSDEGDTPYMVIKFWDEDDELPDWSGMNINGVDYTFDRDHNHDHHVTALTGVTELDGDEGFSQADRALPCTALVAEASSHVLGIPLPADALMPAMVRMDHSKAALCHIDDRELQQGVVKAAAIGVH